MSWQRIDENTYIDDTLVTCTNYELFINELREQGEYYQPDHWTSYQYPAGQPFEPILGVRHSDAIAFCDWLTKREDGEWLYRLLTSDEANVYSLQSLNLSPIGYWITGKETKTEFSWGGPVPKNARKLDYDKTRANTFIYYNNDVNAIVEVGEIFQVVFNQANTNALDLDKDIFISQNLTRQFVGTSTQLQIDRETAYDRFVERNGDLNIELKSALDRYQSLELDHSHIFDRTLKLAAKIAKMFDGALYIFFDIFTLQERIAGRSPAFEGIRLVKERIR